MNIESNGDIRLGNKEYAMISMNKLSQQLFEVEDNIDKIVYIYDSSCNRMGKYSSKIRCWWIPISTIKALDKDGNAVVEVSSNISVCIKIYKDKLAKLNSIEVRNEPRENEYDKNALWYPRTFVYNK